MKGSQDFVDSRGSLGFAKVWQAVRDVFFYGHVREQGKRLEHVGHVATTRGKVHVGFRIEDGVFADLDLAGVRTQQARDAVQQRGFSGAGRTEQDGDARKDFDGDVQLKRGRAGEAPGNADLQSRGRAYFAGHGRQNRRPMRRLSPYTMESTTNENASSTSAMRFAAA